jgi:uncharacterized protein (DUF362 family)
MSPSATCESTPQVMLLPCKSYNLPDLKNCIEHIFKNFAEALPPQGAKVLLKPNMVKALPRESRGTTDPVFLEALIDCGLENGWNLSVGDSPAIGSFEQTAKANGLYEILKRKNIPLVEFSGNFTTSWEGRPVHIAPQLKDFDAIINCPKLKGHGQLYYTGAVKNLFGCMGGKRKVWEHMKWGDQNEGQNFAQMLLDQALVIKPCLNIMDGIMAMAGPGPIHGQPVFEGLIAASTDALALDFAVFKHLSGDASQDPIMVYLHQSNLGPLLTNIVSPLGIPPRGDFYFPSHNQRKLISFRPWILARMAWRDLLSKFKKKAAGF